MSLPAPPAHPSHELQFELTHLVTKFTLCTVLETLGVVCEISACELRENDGTAPRMRKIGLDLIELSVRAFAL